MSNYRRRSVWSTALLVVLFFLFLVTYYLRLDNVVGMFQDDAWYALLAKALATGQGYTLINSPTVGIVPIYPPLYSSILSLIFRMAPEFPENLFFLKSVSILAMLIASILAYYYYITLDSSKELAILLAAIVGLSPSLVFIATSSLMSECVYLMIQLGSIILLHKSTQTLNLYRSNLFVFLGGVLLSLAFLTRSIAIAFLIGAVIYFVTKKEFKKIILLMLGSILIAGPWMIYSDLHRPTGAQRSEVNSYVMIPYTEQFWNRTAGDFSGGNVTVIELPSRIIDNISAIMLSDIGAVVIPLFFPALNQGLAERQTTYHLIVSLITFLLIFFGYIQCVKRKLTIVDVAFPLYLIIIVLWPFPPFRFLLPMVPILLLYLTEGVKFFLSFQVLSGSEASNRRHIQNLNTGLIVLAGILFFLTMVGNINYLIRKNSSVESELPKWIKVHNETKLILDWVSANIPKNQRIASENSALVYLYTGNKTVGYSQPQQNWDLWKNLQVRYYVTTTVVPNTMSQTQQRFYIPYRTNGPLKLSVTDWGPVEIRKSWEYRKSNQMKEN